MRLWQFSRIVVILLGLLPALLWSHSALALETNLEQILLTLASKDPEANPDIDDLDENGIVDRAHTRLVERVLEREDAPNHALLLAIYTLNLIRLNQDNTLTFQCTIFQRLYGLTCDDLEASGAGLFTIGEPAGIDIALEALKDFGLNLNRNNYNLTGGQYLAAAGDLDGDGFTNLQEYNSVCGDFEQFVIAAMDSALTPETLPCCVDCPLTVTAQPEDASKYVGEAHVFSVGVSGVEGNVSYAWFKDGTQIEGEITERLNLGAVDLADAGFYRCVITDSTESATSRTASLVVAERVEITQQPESAVRLVGQSHQFSTAAQGGLGALRYQWRKGVENLGGDAPVLSFGSLLPSDSGTYDVVVSDSNESETSTPATLTVLPRMIIASAPEGAKKYVGDFLLLSISTEGGLIVPPVYTWLKEGQPISGESSELLLDPLTLESAGNYTCRVSDGVDTLTSAVARVQVVEHLAITRQPDAVTVVEGAPFTLRVEVSGGYAPLTYQWFKFEEVTSGNRPRFTIDAATVLDSGTYTVTVSDGTESVTSDPVAVVVTPVLVEGEGVVEGVEEGGTEGVTEGLVEGVNEGIAEGTAEGVVEGALEGVTEGQPEGILEGTNEGATEGSAEGVAEGIAEGVEEGVAEGQPEGAPEGLPEGIVDGEGQSEGEGEGVIEGEGAAEGEGLLEGEGIAEGEGDAGLVASIAPSKDATLYENETGSLANGAGTYLFVGRNGSNEERRAVLEFDLETGLPPRVRILSAALQINLSRTNASQDVAVQEVTREWGEGLSDAPGEEGAGGPALSGDVTWIHTEYDAAFWGTPGGDLSGEPVLTQNIPGTGPQEFSSDALVQLVQRWVNRPATNHGLLLRTTSSGAGTAQRFDSREHAVSANQPRLVVRYEELPLEGEGGSEGEGALEGEGAVEGVVEGEGNAEGLVEGEGSVDGEGAAEGEVEGEGEFVDAGDAAEALLNAFDTLDLNDDNRLTLEDARREIPGLSEEVFGQLDSDGSGEISLRELRDFTDEPQGVLSTSATNLNFGVVATNLDKEVTLYIQNTGTAPLSLALSMELETPFTLATPARLTIPAGAEVNSRVRFVPPAEGKFESTLYLDTLDGTPPLGILLAGEGLLLSSGGCFSSPDGPGGIDLELILLVTLGLAVLAVSIGRMNSPD